MIVFGTRLFGKVDEVPGYFFVATDFFHIWYLPLIPLGSHLVFGESDDGWQGVPVRLSLKSMAVAWLRGFAIAGAVVFAIVGLVQGGWNDSLLRALGCAALFAVLKLYKGFRKATYERAVELAEQANLPPGIRVMVDLEYGMLTEEQAKRAIEALAAGEATEA